MADIGPVKRATTDMDVEPEAGVCVISAVKGNLVQRSALDTWYASLSRTSPAQRMMLFRGLLMNSVTVEVRSVSRRKDELSSCSEEMRKTIRNLKSFLARSSACA